MFTLKIYFINYIQFKQSDYDLLPQRFKNDCVGESCSFETYDYLIKPSTHKCHTANIVVTIKSAADHFGELYFNKKGFVSVQL